jgi:Papain family cysteine protease
MGGNRIHRFLCCLIGAALFLLRGIDTACGQERIPKTVSLIGEFQKLGPAPSPQGDRDVCSLYAITALAEFESNRHSARPKGRLSEEYLIWAANDACGKHHDQAMFYEAIHGLNEFGICAAERMLYASKSDPNRKPSAAAVADAESLRQRWQVEWIKRWSLDQRLTESELLGIKRALVAGHPVACGLRWPKTLRGYKLLGVPPPGQVYDGHSIALVGYKDDPAKKGASVFQFRNSFGPDWGNKGYGEISYAYLQAYANDALWLQCGPEESELPRVRYEAEALPVLSIEQCHTNPQSMNDFGAAMWSGGKQLFCGAERGGWVELGVDVSKPGRYRLRVLATAAPDFGIVRVALDGKPLAQEFDLYSGRVCPPGSLELGTHDLPAGQHRLRFTAVNKSATSKNYSFGLDTVDLIVPK